LENPGAKKKKKKNHGKPWEQVRLTASSDAGTPQGLGPIAQHPETEEELGCWAESSLTAGLRKGKDTKEAARGFLPAP